MTQVQDDTAPIIMSRHQRPSNSPSLTYYMLLRVFPAFVFSAFSHLAEIHAVSASRAMRLPAF